MNSKKLRLFAIALIVAIGIFLWHKDYEYRLAHGQVTAVSLFNWDQEVSQQKDTMPVVVYFYHQSGAPDDRENKAVKNLAWDTAGKVKVVSVDASRPENLVLAIASGAGRLPSFVILYKDRVIHGQDGTFSDERELKRLIEKAVSP